MTSIPGPCSLNRRRALTTGATFLIVPAFIRSADAAALGLVDFAAETVGAEPKAFTAIVGNWVIAADGDNRVLAVDGRRWREGQASSGIADKARAIYGERYAEFLDSVQAYAYFPYAIALGVEDFREGDITVRFKPLDGRIDQGAGILFNLKPNGDYLTVRANALENNLVLWQVVKGRRSSVKWVRNTPTATRQWHELRVSVQGRTVQCYLDGKLTLTQELSAPVTGRVGLWSKADSYVLFDDFAVH
ncbi:LamG domain-containing protein [Methylobacterium nigriterrae]|uniref:LamG domain-containing protein n=1 Tax=Methylobacterium nigriterrae TaxID=3127512 RepID=UPI00301418E3